MIRSSRRHLQRTAKDATFAARLLASPTSSILKSSQEQHTASTASSKSSSLKKSNDDVVPLSENNNNNEMVTDAVKDENCKVKKWSCRECSHLNYERYRKCRSCGSTRLRFTASPVSSSPKIQEKKSTLQPVQTFSRSSSSSSLSTAPKTLESLPRQVSPVAASISTCVSSTHNTSVPLRTKISMDETESRVASLMKENKKLMIRVEELERLVEDLSKPQSPTRSQLSFDEGATSGTIRNTMKRKRRRIGNSGRDSNIVNESSPRKLSNSPASKEVPIQATNYDSKSQISFPKARRSRRHAGTKLTSSGEGWGMIPDFDDSSGEYWLHQSSESGVRRKSYGKKRVTVDS